MDQRIIFESPCGFFRVVEKLDTCADLENLKGDIYNPKLIKEMGYKGTAEELRVEEIEFEELVNREGVYGYVLEKWNPMPGKGWEHVDSCWGFVGQFSESDEKFNHYIVEELKGQIK